jgi:hypothetical protein
LTLRHLSIDNHILSAAPLDECGYQGCRRLYVYCLQLSLLHVCRSQASEFLQDRLHTFRGVLLGVLLDDELGGDHYIGEMQLHVPLIEVDLGGVGLLEGLPISLITE